MLQYVYMHPPMSMCELEYTQYTHGPTHGPTHTYTWTHRHNIMHMHTHMWYICKINAYSTYYYILGI